ncbi:MAG: UvrD-helicase domain-containing protein [Myxococcales bacterium]|nr:UvrD-helicase domain-containing protein [Myxococcales bacterium]
MSYRYAPRPEILDTLVTYPHAIIEASAGTGKTYTLEHLVIDLVLRKNIPIDQILIVTFTEKATAELKLRLRKKLFSLRETPLQAEPPPPNSWVLSANTLERLHQALLSFDRTSITTIHAFCQRVLLENAFAHRRPFKQTLVDSRAAFSRAFISVLRTDLACEPVPLPWLEAWLETQPLDSLHRTAFTCIELQGRLAPTFDPELLQRALHTLAQAPSAPSTVRPMLVRSRIRRPVIAQTLHQLDRILRIAKLGNSDMPALLQEMEADGANHLNLVIATLHEPAKNQPKLQHLLQALEQLQMGLVSFRSAALQMLLPRIQAQLRREKAERGELDFSDMLNLLEESLYTEGGELLKEHLVRRYPVAIIDEFQDTDNIQWRIFRKLYLEPPLSGRLMVIGDPKQAIYSFRGADVGTYIQAREELELTGGGRVQLTDSYRSVPTLVAAINELLDPEVPEPFFPHDITYTPVRAGRTDHTYIEEQGQEGPPAVLLQLITEDTEPPRPGQAETLVATMIAQEIGRLLGIDNGSSAANFHSPDSSPRPLNPEDIFVLTRSSREGRRITQILGEHGIGAAVYKQEGLFQSQEAFDIYTLLSAIADPNIPRLTLRAFGTPFFSVPFDRWANCKDLNPGDPLMAQLLSWKTIADRRDYPRLLTSILIESRITERLLLEGSSDQTLTNYLHLFEVLSLEASAGRPPLRELIQHLYRWIHEQGHHSAASTNIERRSSDEKVVQVMTMHKAKGLEAEVVFLFGGMKTVPATLHPYHEGQERCLFVGDMPPDAAQLEAEEETRRLLYVALTRARTRLYVPFLAPSGVDGLGGTQGMLEPHLKRVQANARHWTVWSRQPEKPLPPPTCAAISGPVQAVVTRALNIPAEDPAPILRLRHERRGPIVTSYSRIKAEQNASHPAPTSIVDDKIEEQGTSSIPPDPDHLPPGAASGRFLHEVIEWVDLQIIRDTPNFEQWYERPEIQTLLQENLERHQRSPAHARHGAELIWNALRTPLDLGIHGQLEGGLCEASLVVREMEFLFPFPAAPAQGFIKGFIDVVFTVEDRIYVLDWKSDGLLNYCIDELDSYVRGNYLLQAEIYSAAVTRLLGVANEEEYEARFGCALYAFFRGMDESQMGSGQWRYRPSWAELVSACARFHQPNINHPLDLSLQPKNSRPV